MGSLAWSNWGERVLDERDSWNRLDSSSLVLAGRWESQSTPQPVRIRSYLKYNPDEVVELNVRWYPTHGSPSSHPLHQQTGIDVTPSSGFSPLLGLPSRTLILSSPVFQILKAGGYWILPTSHGSTHVRSSSPFIRQAVLLQLPRPVSGPFLQLAIPDWPLCWCPWTVLPLFQNVFVTPIPILKHSSFGRQSVTSFWSDCKTSIRDQVRESIWRGTGLDEWFGIRGVVMVDDAESLMML